MGKVALEFLFGTLIFGGLATSTVLCAFFCPLLGVAVSVLACAGMASCMALFAREAYAAKKLQVG